MDVDDIKKILWTDAVEKKFGDFTPPSPLALRRDPQMIRDFFRSELTQRSGLCNRYLSYEDNKRLKLLYSSDAKPTRICIGWYLASLAWRAGI